jgi:hypothetical protein
MNQIINSSDLGHYMAKNKETTSRAKAARWPVENLPRAAR